MNEHQYRRPDGSTGDKRTWPIGTVIVLHLVGGQVVVGRTASVPQRYGNQTWGVRVVGRRRVVPLSACVEQILPTLRPADPEGNSGSEKQIPSTEEGSPRG